jgi:hypothetical protein
VLPQTINGCRGFPTFQRRNTLLKLKLSTKNIFIRNKFLLKHKDSVKHKYERGQHKVSTTAAIPQILPPRHMHGMHACSRVGFDCWSGLDSADLKWIFCEGEKCYACQFVCDCSSGPQDCGRCLYRAIFQPDI